MPWPSLPLWGLAHMPPAYLATSDMEWHQMLASAGVSQLSLGGLPIFALALGGVQLPLPVLQGSSWMERAKINKQFSEVGLFCSQTGMWHLQCVVAVAIIKYAN